jgi:hypothetical protein
MAINKPPTTPPTMPPMAPPLKPPPEPFAGVTVTSVELLGNTVTVAVVTKFWLVEVGTVTYLLPNSSLPRRNLWELLNHKFAIVTMRDKTSQVTLCMSPKSPTRCLRFASPV